MPRRKQGRTSHTRRWGRVSLGLLCGHWPSCCCCCLLLAETEVERVISCRRSSYLTVSSHNNWQPNLSHPPLWHPLQSAPLWLCGNCRWLWGIWSKMAKAKTTKRNVSCSWNRAVRHGETGGVWRFDKINSESEQSRAPLNDHTYTAIQGGEERERACLIRSQSNLLFKNYSNYIL